MLWHFYSSPVETPLCAGLRAARRVSHTRENEDSATQGFKTGGFNFYSFSGSPLIFKTLLNRFGFFLCVNKKFLRLSGNYLGNPQGSDYSQNG
jgi:hypothetical protein